MSKPIPAEVKRERARRYRATHPEACRAAKQRARAKHPETKLAQDRRYRTKNRMAIRARDLTWYHTLTPAEKRARSLKLQCSKYGITVEDYREMERRQGGRCAICGGKNRAERLHIDHDHKTGKARGLLCRPCNMAVAAWERGGIDLIRKLLAYIQRTQV